MTPRAIKVLKVITEFHLSDNEGALEEITGLSESDVTEALYELRAIAIVSGLPAEDKKEIRMLLKNDAEACCPYHETGGDMENSCGGDVPAPAEETPDA